MSDETAEAVATRRPDVTVVMASYNSALYIEAALASVLAQTGCELEVIVVDDASSDNTVELVSKIARSDDRVRLIALAANGGPAVARNAALEVARGRWIAIIDSDDLLHPDRLSRLIGAGEADGADIVADDLLIFDDQGASSPASALRGRLAQEPSWVSLAQYIQSNRLDHRGSALGYLKPVIRADAIAERRYKPSLRIAEDYEFMVRLLASGARFRVYPELTYFYRKHGASISHRLSRRTLEPMLAAEDEILALPEARDPLIKAAALARRQSIAQALAFADLVAALKERNLAQVVRTTLRRPGVVWELIEPLKARLRLRRPAAVEPQTSARPSVCLISKQRLVGAVNGSSAYLLGIVQALHESGFDVHLVAPSPAVFGRLPLLKLRPEMQVFRTIAVHGGVRVGRIIASKDLRTYWLAALTIADRLLAKARLSSGHRIPPAPYAVASPWTRQDQLFLAQHGRDKADFILADYGFAASGIPYVLRPDASSAIVMHDLFSARAALAAKIGAQDQVTAIDEATEVRLLAQADAVVAIQADECAFVEKHLPLSRAILAPMAIVPVPAPQPGLPHRVLFVGSNTAPNLQGLRWFLDQVWPQVLQAAPEAELTVAGGVSAGFPTGALRTSFLGVVADLAPLYRDAAVVISPLLAGSGLKIKLVEALGFGKAIVATPVTAQGVEDFVSAAVLVVDTPEAFAQGVVERLKDPALRQASAEAALEVANRHFSADACYSDLIAFARGTTASPSPHTRSL